MDADNGELQNWLREEAVHAGYVNKQAPTSPARSNGPESEFPETQLAHTPVRARPAKRALSVSPQLSKPSNKNQDVGTPVAEEQAGLQETDHDNDAEEAAIPSLDDRKAPKPILGAPQLSKHAIRMRAQRIFKRRVDGKAKVSEQIFQEWHEKGARRQLLERIFLQVGYDPAGASARVSAHLAFRFTQLMQK